jgi:cyclopropane fatty-acyl-phospholipid synthase-like methyltransferase
MSSNPYTKGYFEDAQGSHYHGYEDWPQFKDRAEWIKKEYSPKFMLEIGAAKGFLIKHLRDVGVSAYGIDVSEYAAQESEGRVKTIDATKPLKLEKYDLVVSFDVLEHIAEEDLPMLFKSLKTAKQQFHMITTNEYHFGGDDTHVSMHDLPWWQRRFEGAGIQNFRLIHAGQQEGLWM